MSTRVNQVLLNRCYLQGFSDPDLDGILDNLDSEVVAYHRSAESKKELAKAYEHAVDVQRVLLNKYLKAILLSYDIQNDAAALDLMLEQLAYAISMYKETKKEAALDFIQLHLGRMLKLRKDKLDVTRRSASLYEDDSKRTCSV